MGRVSKKEIIKEISAKRMRERQLRFPGHIVKRMAYRVYWGQGKFGKASNNLSYEFVRMECGTRARALPNWGEIRNPRDRMFWRPMIAYVLKRCWTALSLEHNEIKRILSNVLWKNEFINSLRMILEFSTISATPRKFIPFLISIFIPNFSHFLSYLHFLILVSAFSFGIRSA